MANMIAVLRYNLKFPVFLISFSLKYVFTLEFSVLKNFFGSFRENRIVVAVFIWKSVLMPYLQQVCKRQKYNN